MDALKRYFPLPWMALLPLAFLHSLYAIFPPALAPLAWVGSAIATLTPVVFMLGIMVSGKGRVSPQFSWHWLPVAIGLLLIGTAHVLSPASVWPLAYGLILAAGGMLAYDHWYSRLGRGQAAVAEGDQFPTLPFLDANGEPVFSDDWQGQKTLVLFYRGNWCPLCVAQVKELAERYQAITDRGYRVVCISPQSQQQTAAIAERFSVPMQFLSDPQAQAADSLGIRHSVGVPAGMSGYDTDTVFPSIFVLDEQGRIVKTFLNDNYRDRPDPDALLATLEQLSG